MGFYKVDLPVPNELFYIVHNVGCVSALSYPAYLFVSTFLLTSQSHNVPHSRLKIIKTPRKMKHSFGGITLLYLSN